MSATFSPAMQAALDHFDVPAMPDGFADRLVARATAEAAVERMAVSQRRSNSPWKRAGRIIGSMGAVGFLSATAAAMGAFGEPLEIPVISNVAREFNLVEEAGPLARAIAATPKAAIPDSDANAVFETVKETETANADNMAKQALGRVIKHPRFDRLTPRQKRVALRRTSRRLVISGAANREDVKSALRDIRQERSGTGQAGSSKKSVAVTTLKQRIENATPAQKAKLQERIEALPAKRKEVIKERLGLGNTVTVAEPVNTDTSSTTAVVDTLETSGTIETPTEPLPTVSAIRQQRTDLLKERMSKATPEQRAARREQLQQRRKQSIRRQQLRDRRAKLRRRRH